MVTDFFLIFDSDHCLLSFVAVFCTVSLKTRTHSFSKKLSQTVIICSNDIFCFKRLQQCGPVKLLWKFDVCLYLFLLVASRLSLHDFEVILAYHKIAIFLINYS